MAMKKTKVRINLPYVGTCNTICSCFTLPKDEGKSPDAEMVQLEAESFSPFEEGTYACGYEMLRQDQNEVRYFAAIASEERLAEASWYPTLKARHQLGRCRIDVSVLAWITVLLEKTPALVQGTQFILLQTAEEVLFMIVEEGALKGVHACNADELDEEPMALTRELNRFLALINTWGVTAVSVANIYAQTPAENLSLKALLKETGIFETINDVLLPDAMATEWLQQGLAKRSTAKAMMDLTPQSWRNMAKKLQQKCMAVLGLLVLALIWGSCAIAFTLLPMQKEQELEAVRAEYKALAPKYTEYLAMRNRLALISRYQDRSNSALEILRMVCAAKPEGVTFLSFNFQQKNIIKISANATTTADVYAFKEALESAFALDPNAEESSLRPAATPEIVRFVEDRKTGLQRIDVDIKFDMVEEEE